MPTEGSGPYYKAHVACEVCGISQRQLNYWISKGVIVPSKIWQKQAEDKPTFVFTFEELALLRVVAKFRAAGLSLQRIRTAMREAQRRAGLTVKDGTYLVTDGESIYQLTENPKVVVDLTKKSAGQLVLAAIALGPVWAHVEQRLRERSPRMRPISNAAVRKLRSWRARTIG